MTIFIYNNYSNSEVTSHYLNIIRKGILKSGKFNCDFINSFKNIRRSDIILVSNPIDLAKLYLKGFRNFMLWMQGIPPEESYMRHKSKIRFKLLSLIDRFALTHTLFTFLVSNEMKMFLERKYSFNVNNYYIMPCYNDKLNLKSFETPSKYSKNTFAYIGSLAAWQCFEQTIILYKQIEEAYSDAKLVVYTKEIEKAKGILNKYHIKNYELDCVRPADINAKLSLVKYGFIIREDVPVNNVATPTKISNYMSAGVIPIITDAVKDFSEMCIGKQTVCILDSPNDSKKLLKYIQKETNKDVLISDYSAIFNTYYSDDYHINAISHIFEELKL